MPTLFQDTVDDALVFARCESFGGGFDADTRSTLLPPDAFQYSENIVIPDNLEARTRPGADRIATNLAAKIQGLTYFDIPGTTQVITAAGAKFYYTDSAMAAWTEMAGYVPSDGDVMFSAAQGIDKLLVTDGSTLRRWTGAAWDAAFTTNANDPPTGCTILLWHAGRMWAAGFPGTGGAGKEDDAVCVSSLLTYGNGDWDLVDKSFRVGSGEGDPVLGLCSIPASVPRQAILGVLKRNSIHLVRTDPQLAPAKYSDTTPPESVSNGLGIVGRRAYAVLGNDLYFAAPDKTFRTLARMEAAAAQYRVSDPLSKPLKPYMERINWNYANLIAVMRYQQLALFSVPLDNAVTPNTVFVFSSRLQQWVGIWSGWTPNCWTVSRFSGVQRLLHGDNAGNVRKWKDYADQADDATYLDDGTAIATKLWSRGLNFGEPLNEKRGFHCEARFSQSNAIVTHTLMADQVAVRQWEGNLVPGGPNLDLDLEFDLSNPSNTPIRRGLRNLQPFSECYVKIESAKGWFSVRNLSLSAFLNSLKNQ